MDEPIVLCTIRADYAVHVAAGSSFEFTCSRCNHRVVLAPSGVDLKAREPQAQIVCMQCLTPEELPKSLIAAHHDRDALLRELRTAVPNPWRQRN